MKSDFFLHRYKIWIAKTSNGVLLFTCTATKIYLYFTVFFSFQVWCENWSKDSLYWSKEDEHSPNHIRVLGVLSNSPEFSAVWNCPKGSTMNPEREKCKIW